MQIDEGSDLGLYRNARYIPMCCKFNEVQMMVKHIKDEILWNSLKVSKVCCFSQPYPAMRLDWDTHFRWNPSDMMFDRLSLVAVHSQHIPPQAPWKFKGFLPIASCNNSVMAWRRPISVFKIQLISININTMSLHLSDHSDLSESVYIYVCTFSWSLHVVAMFWLRLLPTLVPGSMIHEIPWTPWILCASDFRPQL